MLPPCSRFIGCPLEVGSFGRLYAIMVVCFPIASPPSFDDFCLSGELYQNLAVRAPSLVTYHVLRVVISPAGISLGERFDLRLSASHIGIRRFLDYLRRSNGTIGR